MAKTRQARVTLGFGGYGGVPAELTDRQKVTLFSPKAVATMGYLLSLMRQRTTGGEGPQDPLQRGEIPSKELKAILAGENLSPTERVLIAKLVKSGPVALDQAITFREEYDERVATEAAVKEVKKEAEAERTELAKEEIAETKVREPEVDVSEAERKIRESLGLPSKETPVKKEVPSEKETPKKPTKSLGEFAEKYPPKEEAPPERKEVPPERTETPTPKVEAEEPSPPVTLEAATALEDEARRIIHLVQAGRIPPDAADGPFRDIMSRLSQTGWPTSDLISKYAAAADTATPVSRVLGAGPDVEAMATERMRATPEGRDVLRREGEGKAIEGRLEERGEKLSPTQRVLAESIPHVPGEAAREALLRQFLYATATPEEKSAMVAEAEETRSQLRRISYGYAGPPVRFGTGGAVRETEPPTEEQQAARLASSLRERAFLTGGTRGRTAVERVLAAGGTEEEALASLSKARLENIREHRARSPLQIALARRPVEPGSPLRTTDWLQRTYGGGPRLPTFRR